MKYYSFRDYLVLGALVVGGLAVGWAFDEVGWGLAGALLLWVFHQHLAYTRFRRWARRPLQRPDLSADAWQAAADTLFQAVRRQRSRTQRALVRLRQLRSVTESLPDAAVLLDSQGRIEGSNAAASAFFGVERSDTGLALTQLIRDPRLVEMLGQTDAEQMLEIDAPRQEGARLELRQFPLADNRTLLMARDVTRLNRLLTMRQDFVANISHELRTPLTVILGYLEVLEDDSLSAEDLKSLAGRLAVPARRMHALVQDLLLLSQLESNSEPQADDLVPIDIQGLFDTVLRQVDGLAKPSHQFHVEVSSTARLLGVHSEIESAVTNLVTNAIRYSPDGGRIALSWKDDEEGTRLRVSDEGIGIGPEHLGRLTERFYRVDLLGSQIKGGTGLGLAIVKHVLIRHGATLEVSSELGQGSTFSCVFANAQLLTEQEKAAG